MAKTPLDPKLKEKLSQQALRYFHKCLRPALLGEISLWLGLQLDRTEEVLEVLVELGKIRKMSKEDMTRQGLGDRNYYEIIGGFDIKLTGDENPTS